MKRYLRERERGGERERIIQQKIELVDIFLKLINIPKVLLLRTKQYTFRFLECEQLFCLQERYIPGVIDINGTGPTSGRYEPTLSTVRNVFIVVSIYYREVKYSRKHYFVNLYFSEESSSIKT